jgi:(4S)-4-hydroxy-5-phosphonooxypentane-2,3-dione isomerase
MASSSQSRPNPVARLHRSRPPADDAAKFAAEETPMSRLMIVAEFELKPEHAQDFITLMKRHAELSRAEDGCGQFDVLQSREDPTKIFFIESWRDDAALEVHMKVPRMEENRAKYTPWLVSRKSTRCNVP